MNFEAKFVTRQQLLQQQKQQQQQQQQEQQQRQCPWCLWCLKTVFGRLVHINVSALRTLRLTKNLVHGSASAIFLAWVSKYLVSGSRISSSGGSIIRTAATALAIGRSIAVATATFGAPLLLLQTPQKPWKLSLLPLRVVAQTNCTNRRP